MTLSLPSLNAAPSDTAKRPRRSWPLAEQTAYVADFAASGLSATAFCRRLGIRRATLARWRQRAAAVPSAPPHRGRPAPRGRVAASGFAAVTLVSEAPHGSVPAVVPSAPVALPFTLKLRAASGVEVECAGLDVATAVALVRAVLTLATAGAA